MSGRKACKCATYVLVVYFAVFVVTAWYLSSKHTRTTFSNPATEDLTLVYSGSVPTKYSKIFTGEQQRRAKSNGLVTHENDSIERGVYRVRYETDGRTVFDKRRTKGEILKDSNEGNRKNTPQRHIKKGSSPASRQRNPIQAKSLEQGDPKTKSGTRLRTKLLASYKNETDFQTVDTVNSVFVYSAYYNEISTPPVVTVTAIVNRSEETEWSRGRGLICFYLWKDRDDDGHGGGMKVTGKVEVLPDHHGATFGAAFIHCPMPETHTNQNHPNTVSIFINNGTKPNNFLKIQYPQPRQYNFLLCFSPLHGNFNDVTMIVQNLELAQMLGADHAVVYNTSIGPGADKALKYYASKRFLEVKQWRNPPEPIHYKGQISAINDCLLMNRNRSQYLVFMDFDEMIVPRNHDIWSALLKSVSGARDNGMHRTHSFVRLNKSSDEQRSVFKGPKFEVETKYTSLETSSDFGAYAFQSVVFLWDALTNLTTQDKHFAQKHHVHFLAKQRRTVQLWPNRSKNIVDPRTVEIMGIHRVAKFTGKYRALLVNETVALLHHYRWYSPNVPSVKDVSGLRFAPELVQRMKKALSALGNTL